MPKGVKGDSLPVENIAWQMAAKFCEKLSAMTGKKYVLPTEAQWEFAARGGNKSKGYKYSGSNDIDEVAWYDENSRDKPQEEGRPHEVGAKTPNELGICDMSGNVWEWCRDWYGAYSSEPATNPTGAASGKYRVIRGGSWISYMQGCRVSNRSGDVPDNRIFNVGFRVACEG